MTPSPALSPAVEMTSNFTSSLLDKISQRASLSYVTVNLRSEIPFPFNLFKLLLVIKWIPQEKFVEDKKSP